MDPTRSVASGATAGAKTAPAVTPTEGDVRRVERSVPPGSLLSARKSVGYGLPCAKCHLYYAADLDTCPSCNAHERVLPVLPKTPKMQASAEPEIDAAALEQEREEFLRQFKSQLLAAHVEATTAAAPTMLLTDALNGKSARSAPANLDSDGSRLLSAAASSASRRPCTTPRRISVRSPGRMGNC